MAGVCRRVLTGHLKLNFQSCLLSHVFMLWGTNYGLFIIIYYFNSQIRF